MPTELELIALETEFTLYLPFVKRLVLSLPDAGDRTRAAMWVTLMRKIKDDNFKKLRNEHLKLLLFAVHRRSLVGVFEKPPPEELESFHDGLTLLEMTREIIELTEKKKTAGGDDPTASPLPPVVTNLSADLRQYSAAQYIPKFGAHCYMAVSSEPIQMWHKSQITKYPEMSEPPNLYLWEEAFAKMDDGVLAKQAATDKAIALAKAIEAGTATEEDLEPDIDFKKKIDVPACKAGSLFKWKKNSLLNYHQSYDFSDVDNPEDTIGQGKYQLEMDEYAFNIQENSLPGRQRVIIRDPYFKSLPVGIASRRHHGVTDLDPRKNFFFDEESEEEEEEDDDDDTTTNATSCVDLFSKHKEELLARSKACNIYSNKADCACSEKELEHPPPVEKVACVDSFFSTNEDDNCGGVDQYIRQQNQFDEECEPPPDCEVQECETSKNASTGTAGKPKCTISIRIGDRSNKNQACDYTNDIQVDQQYNEYPEDNCQQFEDDGADYCQQYDGNVAITYQQQLPSLPCGNQPYIGQQPVQPYYNQQPVEPYSGQQQIQPYSGQQQVQSYCNQQQPAQNWETMYNNMSSFNYEDGCYDQDDYYKLDEITPQMIQGCDSPPNDYGCGSYFPNPKPKCNYNPNFGMSVPPASNPQNCGIPQGINYRRPC